MMALKNLFSPKEDRTELWQSFLTVLESHASYKEQLEALFELLERHLGMKVYYVYLLNRSGDRFILEHARTAAETLEGGTVATTEEPAAGGIRSPFSLAVLNPPPGKEDRTVSGDEGILADDVRSIIGSPPLEIPYSADSEMRRLTPAKRGQMLSVPMRIGSELYGLLQVGPIVREAAVDRVGQRIDQILFPFCLSLSQARRTQALAEQLESVEARSNVSRKLLGSALEASKFSSLLLELALKSTGTEAGFVAFAEAASDELVIRASQNMPADFLAEVDLLPGRGLFDWLSETERALVVRDWEFVRQKGVKSILAVPLLAEDGLLGVFALVNFEREETFAEYSLRLLTDFSEQIRLVLDNVRLLDQFSQRYLETMKALARSVDVRYPETANHSERVSRTAVAIARKMGRPRAEVEAIETAGLIHDVGMCGVTEIEKGFGADFNHPTIGAAMIEFLTLPVDIAGPIRTHHEWYDGWGFPEGLKGEDIPLGGRILALAEYFVESTTPSEMRQAMSQVKFIKELSRRRGSQFDPKLVDAFLELLTERQEQANKGQPESGEDWFLPEEWKDSQEV